MNVIFSAEFSFPYYPFILITIVEDHQFLQCQLVAIFLQTIDDVPIADVILFCTLIYLF
jgi:hypothetical protein